MNGQGAETKQGVTKETKTARQKLYGDIAKKDKVTQLDRAKEMVMNLSEKQREKFDDWNLDRQMDEAEEVKRQTKLDTAEDYLEEASLLKENMGKMNGLSSGYHDIDGMTRGFAPGELTVVAGETSQGKTLLCVNIACNMLTEGHKIAFLTLEMTKPELVSRFWDIMGDDAFDDVFQNLYLQKADKLHWKVVPKIIERAKDAGAEIVFIDHLHYFSRDFSNTAEELGAVTQEFKQAAIKYEIPVVLISHTRKIDRTQRDANINDLRGSSYIAQDADIVLLVRQPWKGAETTEVDEDGEVKSAGTKKPTERDSTRIEVVLAKNRNRLHYEIGAHVMHEKNGLKIEQPLKQNTGWSCDRWIVPWVKEGKTKYSITKNPLASESQPEKPKEESTLQPNLLGDDKKDKPNKPDPIFG